MKIIFPFLFLIVFVSCNQIDYKSQLDELSKELNEEIQNWSQIYNFERLHKNLGNISPEKFEQNNKNLYI
jgi:transposase InsO family protein